MKAIALLLVLSPAAGLAAGTIQGTVRDLSGAPVPGAAVEAKNAQTRMVYSAVSSGSGSYSLTQVPPGKYAVTVTKAGMQPYSHAYLTVEDAKSIREDVDLDVDRNPAPVPATAEAPPAPVVLSPLVPRAGVRDFYAEDAEFDLISPMLIVNDRGMELAGAGSTVKGRMVWLYLPGHGRYVLSLAPLAGFGFGGEVGGTALKFQAGDQQVEIDSNERILMGSASYNLYVLKQPEWKPAEAEAGPMIGSAESAEALLK